MPADISKRLAFGLAVGVATIILLTERVEEQSDNVISYSDDDAAAMAWLREHAAPGDVLMNDGTLEEIFSSGEADIFRTRLACLS